MTMQLQDSALTAHPVPQTSSCPQIYYLSATPQVHIGDFGGGGGSAAGHAERRHQQAPDSAQGWLHPPRKGVECGCAALPVARSC